MSCEQAQKNADAIVKYPIALHLLGQKDEMIRLKENEIYHVRAGFSLERKDFSLERKDFILERQSLITDRVKVIALYDKEVKRKERWRFATVFFATAP